MRNIVHDVDFCVVGGGLAGMCAAIAAARRGVKVALVHDRPVLGGNASSEVRMWVCGARGENNLETGIIEEILLENLHRNPYRNFSIWDSVLYEKARFEPNITLLLNCSCNDAVMNGNKIASVRCWQLTSETWHEIRANYFADCSGDSILAPLSGAEYRCGRESAAEFGEDIAPVKADDRTMGMSCLIQIRQTDSPKKFTPPHWANVYETDADMNNRPHMLQKLENFWWMELGGVRDTIHDTEEIRDELLKVAFGVWDHIKNRGDHGADNWMLDWVGFLPGKRESRRMVGDHILTQNDVRSGVHFDDIIAYGGWPMDDHHPEGFNYPGQPTIFHRAPSPFGIPYRCVYSRNIDNLFFAGRNISATHAAMSSTRVMATCATLGQAVGTAAAIANENAISPRETGKAAYLKKLQQSLMEDDCYLPGLRREVSQICAKAELTASHGTPQPLRSGIDRPIDENLNAWQASPGDWAEYRFNSPQKISEISLVFDSNLSRKEKNIQSNYPLQNEDVATPQTLVADFDVEIQDAAGNWEKAAEVRGNYQRAVKLEMERNVSAVRLVILRTHGKKSVNVFGMYIR